MSTYKISYVNREDMAPNKNDWYYKSVPIFLYYVKAADMASACSAFHEKHPQADITAMQEVDEA